jgi:large subunit ribosomal protein L2
VIGKIRGPPRPPAPFKKSPEPNKYRYKEIYPPDGRYTTKPMYIQKLGGRDPETGRVVVKTAGGGNNKKFRWVDFKRHAPEGETIEEKVYHIRYDPIHTYLIALVANGGHRRWIIASENMKPGDIIKTTNIIPKNPIRVQEGDAWPLGAMPPGTLIHNIEEKVGEDQYSCQFAGAHAAVGRRIGNMIVVKLPNKKEVALDERCMATVGKASNTEHHLRNLLCPQRLRWLGRRPVSGHWHRKDGYCGKKLHPPKPLQFIYSENKREILGTSIPDINVLQD